MSDENENHLHEQPDDDKKAKDKPRSPVEQMLDRHGENAKQVTRIGVLVAGIGWLAQHYIFPNAEVVPPLLFILVAVGLIVLHHSWKPIFSSEVTLWYFFCGAVLMSGYGAIHFLIDLRICFDTHAEVLTFRPLTVVSGCAALMNISLAVEAVMSRIRFAVNMQNILDQNAAHTEQKVTTYLMDIYERLQIAGIVAQPHMRDIDEIISTLSQGELNKNLSGQIK